MATHEEQLAFIHEFKELSFSAANQLHVYAYVPLAQWALESEWGTKYNPRTHNIGGIMNGNAVASFSTWSDFVRVYVNSMKNDCPNIYHGKVTPGSSVEFILEGTAYNTVNPDYAKIITEILSEIEGMLTPADKPWIHQPTVEPKPTPTPAPVQPPVHTRARRNIVTIDGDDMNYGFYFTLEGVAAHLHLDTGAYELLISKPIADALNLPNMGDTQVSGVTGSETMYNSKVSFKLGSREYKDVPCVVDPNYPAFDDGLFGFRFLEDNGINVDLDIVNHKVTFYDYE